VKRKQRGFKHFDTSVQRLFNRLLFTNVKQISNSKLTFLQKLSLIHGTANLLLWLIQIKCNENEDFLKIKKLFKNSSVTENIFVSNDNLG
jgi:hypothetical protein